ncbi:hypothetical protein FOA52_008222, partial [Chlamydomonas sp. UWO 241]
AAGAAADEDNGDGSGASREWRLIFCRRPGMAGQVALGQVLRVLAPDWGYTMQDVRSFDFAAVLKTPPSDAAGGGRGSGLDPGGPACAALLDVYGTDVAELFVVGTAPRARRQGCARDLVLRAIAPGLADAGVRRLAVSVDEGDEPAAQLWSALGFAPLAPSEHRRLAWQLPTFGREASEGTVYYCLDLGRMRGQGQY